MNMTASKSHKRYALYRCRGDGSLELVTTSDRLGFLRNRKEGEEWLDELAEVVGVTYEIIDREELLAYEGA